LLTNNFSYQKWVPALFALAAILLFVQIGSTPIYILDEAKNAQCAREMWYSQNWLVPTFNGELRTDKPPLHYWFMSIAYQLFGVGSGSARFFSTVMGMLTLWISYAWAKKWGGQGVAFFTLLSLVLSVHFIFEFRLSVPDPYLIFFTASGLMGGFNYLQDTKNKLLWILITAISLALAMLAKGPVALGLPGLVFSGFIIWQKKWWVLKDWRVIMAGVLALGIALPWYFAVHKATNGAFTEGFFFEHNFNRFSAEMEGHGGPFFITPLIVLIGMLPFSLLLFKSLRPKNGFYAEPVFAFSFLVIMVYMVFFSISRTKLPNYPMPCYPFAGLLIAVFINRVFEGQKQLPRYFIPVLLSFAALLPTAAYFGIRAEESVADLWWVAAWLLILPAGILYGFSKFRENNLFGFSIIVISWALFSFVFILIGYPLLYQRNPVSSIKPMLADNRIILAYKAYNPAFNFNVQPNGVPIKVYKKINDLQKAILLYQAEVRSEEIPEIYVLSRKEFIEDLNTLNATVLAERRDLFELPTTIILQVNK